LSPAISPTEFHNAHLTFLPTICLSRSLSRGPTCQAAAAALSKVSSFCQFAVSDLFSVQSQLNVANTNYNSGNDTVSH
jgi:hypothetical protein